MVEGGRESTGAHSPGLVVAFIRRRPWAVVVSEGACRSWGSVVIRGWGIVLVCWWGDRPRALEGCAGSGARRPSWFHRDGLSVVVGVRVGGGRRSPWALVVHGSVGQQVVVVVKQWWWWSRLSGGGGGCRRAVVVVVVTVKQWWWWFSSSGGGGRH